MRFLLKLVFFILFCTSANSKDLTGITLDCFISINTVKVKQLVAINFINSEDIKFLLLETSWWDGPEVISKKISGVYKYSVGEESILIRNQYETGFPYDSSLNRKTLILGGSMVKPKCKILDTNKEDPFKKIENYTVPKKIESKNIL